MTHQCNWLVVPLRVEERVGHSGGLSEHYPVHRHQHEMGRNGQTGKGLQCSISSSNGRITGLPESDPLIR
jgi:hypothetical protein